MNRRTNYSSGSLHTFHPDVKNQLTHATPVGKQTHDDNGNLLYAAGSYHGYAYDDENRLVRWYYYGAGYDGEGQPTSSEDWRTDFVYDGLGRLRKRVEYEVGGLEWWVWSETYYIYDGMRVIQERGDDTVSYTRGSDLSGTLEGAGGIGGLLGRSHGYSGGNWSTHNYYHADGGGNVTYLVNSSQGLAASYKYDAYGNLVSQSGSLAGANVYRFSSKEWLATPGLYYYGYRWYHPNLQRWPNRDAIEELGFQELLAATEAVDSVSHLDEGHNLYAYVGNSPVNKVDPLGLAALDFPPVGCDVKVTCKCQIKFGISWAGPEITITDTKSGETWSGKVDARNGFKADIGPCSVEVKCFVNVDFDKADDCYAKCREKCSKLPGGPTSILKSKCRTRCFNNCVKKR